MKYEYTQWDEWKILIPTTQDWQPIDLTDKEVILIIDWEEDRLEEVNKPWDHIDPEKGQTLFIIPEDETIDMNPWEYKIYIKIRNEDWTGKTTSIRKDFTILPE